MSINHIRLKSHKFFLDLHNSRFVFNPLHISPNKRYRFSQVDHGDLKFSGMRFSMTSRFTQRPHGHLVCKSRCHQKQLRIYTDILCSWFSLRNKKYIKAVHSHNFRNRIIEACNNSGEQPFRNMQYATAGIDHFKNLNKKVLNFFFI